MRGIVFTLSVILAGVGSAYANNTVSFDNQSGEPALAKLIGPTNREVEVPNGAKTRTDAAAGRYIIKVRYGTSGKYRYSKGEEFEVKETATTRSEITITLHKVVAGNYNAKPISEEEFGETKLPQPAIARIRDPDGSKPHSGDSTGCPALLGAGLLMLPHPVFLKAQERLKIVEHGAGAYAQLQRLGRSPRASNER